MDAQSIFVPTHDDYRSPLPFFLQDDSRCAQH